MGDSSTGGSDTGQTDTLHILVVDDEQVSRAALEQCFVDTPHRVLAVATPREALEAVESGLLDVAFVDLRLDGASGLDLIPELLERAPWLKVVLMTAHSSVESAVDAIRAGAVDYLSKPFRAAEVRVLAEKLLAVRRREREAAELRESSERRAHRVLLKSRDPEMQRVHEMARRVAPSTATVLLLGESGTGKGVLARAIHEWSDRSDGPFSVVNCPSLTEALLQSELFGHERGAFTGAVKTKPGRIETTKGGTLFLDEIGDLPPSIQPQLLRFIQDREFERVGGTRTLTSDVRILAATNQDLREAVREGRFREDLFYRLNVIEITVPALRDRPDDIVGLAELFLHRFARENNRTVEGFTDDAVRRLLLYTWPGNVRELQNAVERAVILAQTRAVGPELLPDPVPDSVKGADAGIGDAELLSLEELERHHIRHVMAVTDGVQEAAQVLGISTATLWRRRKKYGL